MAAVNVFTLLSGVVFIFFILGLHNFLTNFEENGCQMTYMFEYPQYVKISLSPNITNYYSRYGLYAYGEGQFTERLRQMKFNGIPVLFIPGNSGSFKQVRSLASVSLRKTLSSHLPFHFDYFAVDLNDEYSGLFGGVLQDQTDFVHYCILKILQLYKPGSHSPTSVVLIGHSMGGIVAKGLLLKPDFDPNMIQVIITFSTPHRAPVIAIDRYLIDYHSKVNTYWLANKLHMKGGNLSHVTLISISGGYRDLMVRSGLTQAEEADINVLSTAIPTVWLSTDHLCSMWCKELVLVIVRALFDIIDLKKMQVSNSSLERKNAFEYHLLKRTAGKRLAYAFHPREAIFDPSAQWDEYFKRQISVVEPYGVKSTSYTMVRLIDDPKHSLLLAVAANVETKDWVFVCSANTIQGSSRICHAGINLSNETQLLPSHKWKQKYVFLDLAELRVKGFTHVVLRLPPTEEQVQLRIDVHSVERRINISLPLWLSFSTKLTIVESTDDNSIHYELALPGFDYTWQAYRLYVLPISCRVPQHEAVAIMEVPWSREENHVKITETSQKPLYLRLHTPKPTSYTENGTVKARLILDPNCKYSVRIQSSMLDSLGQLVRFYMVLLLPYMAAILLLTLRWQLLTLAQTGQCVMFHTAIGSGAKPYYILPVVKICSRVLGMNVVARLLSPYMVQFDPSILQDNHMDFLLLPLFLYMVAFSLSYFMGFAFWLAVIFSGQTAHKMALRFLAKTLTGTMTWSEWAFAGMSKLPAVVAALLLALCYSTCGALSLCVGAFFYFLKLSHMYEDYLEELFRYSVYLVTRGSKNKKKEDARIDNHKANDVEPSEDTSSYENIDKLEEEEEKETELPENEDDENKESLNETEKEDVQNSDKAAVNDAETIEDDISKDVETEDDSETDPSALSELHFTFTSLLLWLVTTVINIPSVLVWAHNYQYNTKLRPDPSFLSGIMLCFCAGILWQRKAPIPNLKHYEAVGNLLYLIAVFILVFGTISLYNLSTLLSAAIVIVTLHQVFGAVQPLTPTEKTRRKKDD